MVWVHTLSGYSPTRFPVNFVRFFPKLNLRRKILTINHFFLHLISEYLLA